MYIHVPVLIMQEIPSLHLYSGAVSRKEKGEQSQESSWCGDTAIFFFFPKKQQKETDISKKQVVTAVTLESGRLVGPLSASYWAKSPHLCLASPQNVAAHATSLWRRPRPSSCVLANPSALGPCLLTALLYVPERPPLSTSLPFHPPTTYTRPRPCPPPSFESSYRTPSVTFSPSLDSSIEAGRPACLPTVWLHISSLLCFVLAGFLATDNSHDRAPG